MNWNYISGFFDADGSICVAKSGKGQNKTIQVSFHNNELTILKQIQCFIQDELGFRGSIARKKAKKETHSDAYDLQYRYYQGYLVSQHLNSFHPVKAYRISLYAKIQKLTKRNGKYTDEEFLKREELISKF